MLLEHLQEFAIPLGILQNLAKVAENVLQEFAIHICQNPSIAKTSLRAPRFPRGVLVREINARPRTVDLVYFARPLGSQRRRYAAEFQKIGAASRSSPDLYC
jgi:hypothetical protein